jgi:hypothetical protein
VSPNQRAALYPERCVFNRDTKTSTSMLRGRGVEETCHLVDLSRTMCMSYAAAEASPVDCVGDKLLLALARNKTCSFCELHLDGLLAVGRILNESINH